MLSLLTPEAVAAGSDWLDRLDSGVRERGRQLADSRKVQDWFWEPETGVLDAVVQGGLEYEVTIAFRKGRFRPSECTCPYASNCKHAAAAMMVALRAAGHRKSKGAGMSRKAAGESGSPARPTPQDALLTLAEERLGKPLPVKAAIALATVGGWWFSGKRTLPLNDLLSIAGAPNYWTREEVTVHGKATRPESAWDYLACVETVLSERGHVLPDPLPALIDRKRQAELLAQHRAEIVEKEWRTKVKNWAEHLPDDHAAFLPELRLRLTDTGAVVEWRKPGQAEFVKATSTGLKDLPQSGRRTAEDLVLAYARGSWGQVRNEFRKEEDDLVELLRQFIMLPRTRHVLVGDAGQPVRFHDEPLVWSVGEEDSHEYLLHLRDASGRIPPEPIAVVLSTPSWWVTSSEIWPLERWPFPAKGASARMNIPASALESREGITVLRKMGLPLPSRLQARVKTLKATVTVRCRIEQASEGTNPYLKVVAAATYEDGAQEEHLAQNGWMPVQRKQKSGGGTEDIVTYDRTPLVHAAAWMSSMELKAANAWRTSEVCWERRVTKDFPEQFLQWMAGRPQDVVVELDAELASLREGVVAATVRLDVEEAGMDWFDLRVALDVADLTLSQAEIQLLLKAQGKWMRIQGKGWRKLQFEMSPEHEAELAAMGLAVADFDGSPQRLHALQLASSTASTKALLPAERAEALQRRAEEIRTRVQPDVPAIIQAQLRPYQLEGFHFLAYLSTNRFGGVLADDMGLGKTLQSLAWIAWLREQPPQVPPAKGKRATTTSPVLVVCPKSVQENWRQEAERFCPGLRVAVWSREEAGGAGLEDGETDLLVIHYQQLRQHEEVLKKKHWLAVILDEAQAIKNPSSQSAQAACALQAQHRLALSGTPIENRLLDLWSILGFAMPGVLGNRSHFAKHFDGKSDPLARRRLAARVRPFLLRRTKKEVAQDLPDRMEEDLLCELEGKQAQLYQAELKRARAELLKVRTSKQLDKARFNILTSLLRLRQICCHPELVLKGEITPSRKSAAKITTRGTGDSAATGSAKLDALVELLEPIMEEGGKVLVFSQFVDMLELVRAQLEARQWPHFLLTGQTDDRGSLVNEFQTCEGPAVFLISLKAGGFGLNLTSASYVVLCDPWWNPAVEAQAIDRTHRIGQTQKVNAYRLIVKDSIEEKIRLLQKQKSALAHDILGEENFASALTMQDFQFLLGEG